MKNYIGTDIPQKYYIGDTRVYKLYKGAALLWDSETPSGVTVTYDVTSTTNPTIIANNVSGFTKMYVDGGSGITPNTSYIFSTTGEHTVVWDLIEPVLPQQAFQHVNGTPVPVLSVEIGDGVTEIGSSAFYFCRITGITIPNSVKKIGEGAFGSCQYLGSVSLPSGLTTIGRGAFVNTSSLHQITIPETVTEIGDNAFDSSGLYTVNIPGSVTGLNHTFAWCSYLTSVTFSPRVSVEPWDYLNMYSTFVKCHYLTEVTFPSDCNVLLDSTFRECNNLTSVTISNTHILQHWIFIDASALTTVNIIPDAVDAIWEESYIGCTSLTALTLPYAVAYHAGVIAGASSLRRVQFGKKLVLQEGEPAGMRNLEFMGYPFGSGCTSLNRIDVLCTGDLTWDGRTTPPANAISSDLPANGKVYYYYKSASETNFNSQTAATALANLIGRGWTAVSGGIWNGTPAQ